MSKKNAQKQEVEQLPSVTFIAKVTMKSRYPNIFRMKDSSFTFEICLPDAIIAEEFIKDFIKYLPMQNYLDWVYDINPVGSEDPVGDIITDPVKSKL